LATREPLWRDELDRVVRSGGGEEEGEEGAILDLQKRHLGDAEITQVAERLSQGDAQHVKFLNVHGNCFGDAGAASIAELLREASGKKAALECVNLTSNCIGPEGILALAGALRENSTLTQLSLWRNPGVDARGGLSNGADAAAGVDSLVAAIGVNTTLQIVDVGRFSPHNKTVLAALADTDGRHLGRERFRARPLTKAVRKSE
jgi:Leucine Rich repeat